MFNEANTTEEMIISVLKSNGWKYIPPQDLPRSDSDVIVAPMLRDALIRLNPEIAEDPSRADEVIRRLNTRIARTNSQNLITDNERFKRLIFEENSYPFGHDGRVSHLTAKAGGFQRSLVHGLNV